MIRRFNTIRAAFARFSGEPLARAVALSLGLQLIGIGLLFVQGVLAARALAAVDYGVVAVAMSVITILAAVSQLGFASLAVREIPVRRAAEDFLGMASFARTAAAFVLAMSLIVAVTLWVAAPRAGWLGPHYAPILGLCGLLLPPLALIGLVRGLAQGFGQIALSQAPGDVLRPLLIIMALMVALATHINLTAASFVWVAIGATAIATLVSVVLLWRTELMRLPWTSASLQVTAHLVAAMPFLGLGLIGLLEGEVSTLLLGWLAGPRETGLFQPVVRIAPLMILPVQAALVFFGPQSAALWQRGEVDELRELARQFTRMTVAATIVASLGIAALGPFLLGIYGAEFRQSAQLLWPIAAAQIFAASCGPGSWLLISSNRSGWALSRPVDWTRVKCAFGSFVDPRLGAWGAAAGMSCGIALTGIMLSGIARKRVGFDPTLVGALIR